MPFTSKLYYICKRIIHSLPVRQIESIISPEFIASIQKTNLTELKEILAVPFQLSDKTVDIIANCTKLVQFSKDELLIEQGRTCDKIYFIASGIVRMYYSYDGNEDVRLFALEGDIITSVSSFAFASKSVFNYSAMCETKAYVMTFDDMRRVFRESHEFQQWTAHSLFGQIGSLEYRYLYSGIGNALLRYASFITNRPKDIIDRIPLKHLASYLKMTPQTLSRIRRQYIHMTDSEKAALNVSHKEYGNNINMRYSAFDDINTTDCI